MKGWENNIIPYIRTRKAGACPKCGSTNVEVTEHQFESRRSITFNCKDCGSGDHFDGFSDKRNT